MEMAHQSSSTKIFLRDALGLIAATINAPYVRSEIRLMSHLIEETYASQEQQKDFWQKTVQGVLTKAISERAPRARLYQAKKSAIGLGLFSVPVRALGGRCSGAIVLVAPCEDRTTAEDILVALGALISLVSMLLGELGEGARKSSSDGDVSSVSNLRKGTGYTTPTELAFALTNKLRTRDGSDLVAMARVKGNKVKLLSISGLDEISGKSPGVRAIQAAMEECLDMKLNMVSQAGDELSDEKWATGGRLHQAWRDSQGGAAVASLPLMSGDRVVAVLAIQRSARMGFKAEDLEEYHNLVDPYVETLEVIERASRSLFAHLRGSLVSSLKAFFAKGAWGSKLKFLVPGLAALWLIFGKMNHEISVSCEVVPLAAQQIGSPLDGRLLSVAVHAGDRVQDGDELCRFDAAAFRLELSQLQSRSEILELEERAAVASGSPVDIQLAQANRREVEANIELVEYRIKSAVVRAPGAGVIVKGDLDEHVGDMFQQGQDLFTLASDEGWQLELEIPESDVSYVKEGVVGRFASMARPEEPHEFSISHISPSAEMAGVNNVFMAKADVDLSQEWVRSGVRGLANVQLGKRASWWVLFHGAGDWLRLNFWL